MRLNLRSASGLVLAGGLLGTVATGAVLARVLLGVLDAGPGPERPAAGIPPLPLRGNSVLAFPVPAAESAPVPDTFLDPRSGSRTHHAVDIAAPRNAVIVAVADGEIERLSESPLGGISIYQRDAAGRYCFYYAHLERYAAGLEVGQTVRRGQPVGFVGTSGNAPAHVPHLHFAVHEAGPRSCAGRPVDPLPLLRGSAPAG